MRTSPALTITRLGAEGDGHAEGADGQSVFVPFALPGETVANGGNGPLSETSPDRVAATCRHFTVCGGCVAQHMGDELYARWKRDTVVTAFQQRNLTPLIDDLVRVAPHSRRRATFSVAIRPRGDGPREIMGFHARASADVFALEECPVLTPRIVAAIPHLKLLVGLVKAWNAETRIAVADLDQGLDVQLEGIKASLSADLRARLGEVSARGGFARLSLGRETIIEHGAPGLVTRAGTIVPPPGGFFQAVAAAETEIVDRMLAAIPKAKRIADLFSGLGTLSLPLAQKGRVLAADGDKLALEALARAARNATGLKPIETRLRDLFREPLSLKELEGVDAVVLDPPRAGAKAQCEVLAKSKIPTVVMVSCSPATLGRDARALVDGGYKIERVTPIDQFLWSHHVETVTVFRR
jgi:23S rRNA (uracil1939-C5)-methyltransferase